MSTTIPSLTEHTDLLQVVTVCLIGVIMWMIKRWDRQHTAAMEAIQAQCHQTAEQLNLLARDFYQLRGEHNAHHNLGRRWDDQGFRNEHGPSHNHGHGTEGL